MPTTKKELHQEYKRKQKKYCYGKGCVDCGRFSNCIEVTYPEDVKNFKN